MTSSPFPTDEQLEALHTARYKLIRAEALLREAEELLHEWGYAMNATDVRKALKLIQEILDF